MFYNKYEDYYFKGFLHMHASTSVDSTIRTHKNEPPIGNDYRMFCIIFKITCDEQN